MAMPSRRRPAIRYLNTDLDLVGNEDLLPLVRALERGGMYRLHLDTKGPGKRQGCLEMDKQSRTPNGHISGMLKVIENLKPRPRGIWDRCEVREFNLGYDSGFRPPTGQFNHLIPARTLLRMATVGVSMRVTIYPPDEEGPWPSG